ncbi:MAG: hypothetical protein P4K92_05770 [Candidatus Nitrosotalea sp.]|nr:hypothetical protein [Candidatus Nitrosotalea sp.]
MNKKIIPGIAVVIIDTKLAYNQSFEITSQKNTSHEKTSIRAKHGKMM